VRKLRLEYRSGSSVQFFPVFLPISFQLEVAAMEEPPNDGGDGGGGGGDGGGRSGRDTASQGGESVEEVLDELWPSQPSSVAANLAAIWVANPATSERYTYSLGGVE
jgi:hypothetical protein